MVHLKALYILQLVLIAYIHIPAHRQNQLNLGQDTTVLCQNNDYCRTAVFDEQNLLCTLFEESSTVGRIVSQIQLTLLSFRVCDGEPEYSTFSPPIKPVLMQTVLSNMKNTIVLPIYTTYNIMTMANRLYLPKDYLNRFKIYGIDTYTPLDDFVFPITKNGTDYRLDGTSSYCYLNPGGSAFTLYSSITGISNSVGTASSAVRTCFSTNFVFALRASYHNVDVYLRTPNNFSASYIFTITLSAGVAPCVILNDQLSILISKANGNERIQSTILNRINYTSLVTLPTVTWAPVIGQSTVNIDTTRRIYVQTK